MLGDPSSSAVVPARVPPIRRSPDMIGANRRADEDRAVNCLEARRRLMVEPESADPRLLEHLEFCPDCSREAQHVWSFEKKLRSALDAKPSRAIEERIQLERNGSGKPMRRYWALAASLVLVAGLSALLLFDTGGSEDLRQVVIRHIEQERRLLETHGEVPVSRVNAQLARYGAKWDGAMGGVRHLGQCHIRKQQGLHLVLDAERGPVTVLFMPGEFLDPNPRRRLRGGDFHGLLFPTDYGSIAVVGESGEFLRSILDALHPSSPKVPAYPAI